jgi:hypothetical protein
MKVNKALDTSILIQIKLENDDVGQAREKSHAVNDYLGSA